MATTTNYGWTTPDDTALVKDGAAAIRTLGSSVDTTTKALNPSTTLGDIEYRSSTANTNTRLGIGTTGQFLTVAGGVPSWAAAPASGGMTLITTTTFDNSVATYTYSSLGSYKHLYIVGQGLTTNQLGSVDSINIRFNSDTGSNYNRVSYGNSGGSGTFNAANGTSAPFLAYFCCGDNADTSLNFGSLVGWIPDYAGSGYKSVQGNGLSYLGGTTARSTTTFGTWNNTNAITSFTIFANSGANFKAGIIKVYGVS
jgi:hypothetical protein